MITRTSQYNQRGEVAALMTLVAMGIMLAGLIVGTNIGTNRQQAQTTQSRAAGPIQISTEPTPQPAPAVPPVFTPERFTCQLGFRYTADPTVYKLLLRRPGSTDVLDISRGLPQTISQNRDGVTVFFDPNKNYPNPNLRDFQTPSRTFKVGDIVVSLKPSNDPSNRYFLYDRSSAPWMNVAGPVELYIEFDKGPSNPDKNRYFQTVSVDNNCGTVTPTPPIITITPTATPTATPTPTPETPTVTLTPQPPQCNSLCQSNSDCSTGLVCYKGSPDLPIVTKEPGNPNQQQTGVCRHPACRAESDCVCNPSDVEKPPTACKFEALAYIEECDGLEFRPNETSPRCTSLKPLRFDEAQNKQANIWGVSNNKQNQSSPANVYQYLQKFNKTAHLWTFDKLFSVKDTVRINEYRNGEDATVTTFFDQTQYRILQTFLDATNRGNVFPQKGKRIDTCTNSGKPGQEACNRGAEEATSELDQIGGLTVACGNSIVYGWTVVKCKDLPIDLIMVVDMSLTMRDYSVGGINRTIEAKSAASDVIQKIQNGKFKLIQNVGVVKFNATAQLVNPLTPVSGGLQDMLTKINGLTNAEYTDVYKGLDLAARSFDPKSKNVKVILLISDGVVHPVGVDEWGNDREEQKIISLAQALKEAGIRIVSLGVGDGFEDKLTPPSPYAPQILGKVASCTNKDDCPQTESATSATDFSKKLFLSLVVQKPQGVFEFAYNKIGEVLNTCSLAEALFAQVLRATDINGDGVVNTIDYFMVLDNYFAKGDNIKEDINNDGVVNSLDLSLVTDRIGQSYTASQ